MFDRQVNKRKNPVCNRLEGDCRLYQPSCANFQELKTCFMTSVFIDTTVNNCGSVLKDMNFDTQDLFTPHHILHNRKGIDIYTNHVNQDKL